MTLKSYASLYEGLKNKTRGRKHEAQISQAPDIWASLASGGNIECYFEPRYGAPQHVATLYPDNSLVVDIHGWHTQASCKIIAALTPNGAWSHKGVVWCNNHPVLEPLRYDGLRHPVIPDRFRDMASTIAFNLAKMSIDDMPARERMMIELGTYKPQHAVTKNVIAFVTGKADKSALSPRDIYTVLDGSTHARIQERVFEEMI